MDIIDKFLGEAEFTFDTLDVNNAYTIFNQSYIKSTGKSWNKDKFIERAKNWTFFGDENGYVAVRVQAGGMVKLVGVAGSSKSIYKGIIEIKKAYSSMPLWGMVSKEIANQAEKMGFKVLRLKNDIKSKIFLKLIKNIIPSSVFGGAKINGINADGTIKFEYSDIGEANKVLVGNEIYFDGLKEKIISSDKIPNIIKNKVDQLFSDSGLLSEKRKGGEKNPKIHYTQMLEKYINRDDIYVSFTHLVKAGINPNSSYSTPLGVYCFPLKKSAEFYGKTNGIINFPFASDRPYIFILKEKANIKKLDISKYTSSDGEKDIAKLIEIYKDKIENIKDYVETAKQYTNFRGLGVGVFWYFCKMLSENLHGSKSAINWNKILRKDLGYGLVIDEKHGVIHNNEKCQAFFTDSSQFNIINYLDNPDPSDQSSEAEWKSAKSKRNYKGNSTKINWQILANDFNAATRFIKTRNTTATELENLLYLTKDTRKMVDLILKTKRSRLEYTDIDILFKYTPNPEKLEDDIISIKGSSLTGSDAHYIFNNSNDHKKTKDKMLAVASDSLVKSIFKSALRWDENLAIRVANIEGEKLEYPLTVEIFKGHKSDKLANIIFNLKKNSLDEQTAESLLTHCVDYRKMVDQIFEHVKPVSNGIVRKIINTCPNEEKKLIYTKILESMGPTLSDQNIFYIFGSLGDDKKEAAAEYIIDVQKDSLSPAMIAFLLRNSEDATQLIPKIIKNKKYLDHSTKIAIVKSVKDINQAIEMVGGIDKIEGADILRAMNEKGLLDYVINNQNEVDEDTIRAAIDRNDRKEIFLYLKKIITKDPSVTTAENKLNRIVDGTRYMIASDAEEIMNLIFENIKNKPISVGAAGVIMYKDGGKYIERLVDAINVHLDLGVVKIILNYVLYHIKNPLYLVKKIWDYKKNDDTSSAAILRYINLVFPSAKEVLTEIHLNYKEHFSHLYH